MEIRNTKDGIKYREMISLDGKRIKGPFFSRKTDAKAWKAKVLTDREKSKILGHQYVIKKRQRFSEFASNWLESKVKVQRSASTYKNYEQSLRKHFYPKVGDLYLNQITSAHADMIIKELLGNGHNEKGTNIIMQIFRTVLLEAEKEDLLIKSPLKYYPTLKEKQRLPSYWNSMQIGQFLKANSESELYPLFVVALNTGMRKGELAGLCWDKVDFDRKLITISRIRDRYGLRETTKTGIIRFVPMNDVTRGILLELYKTRSNEFVFTKDDGSLVGVQHLYRNFQQAQKMAKMDCIIRFHDLRHCFASHFMMNNGNLYDLQKILGHTKSEMTQLYAHLSPDHLANATQIVSFKGNPPVKTI